MTTIATLIDGYLIVGGLLVGSFIGLAADRLPRGESVVRPASHCLKCGRRLNLVDLVPIAGYIVRRGRCATCMAPIGPASVMIEAVSGALMAGAVIWFGPWPGAAVGFALVGIWGAAVVARALRQHEGRRGRLSLKL